MTSYEEKCKPDYDYGKKCESIPQEVNEKEGGGKSQWQLERTLPTNTQHAGPYFDILHIVGHTKSLDIW